MKVNEISAVVPDGSDASGQSVSVSTSSAASSNAIEATEAYVYSTVECFIVKGATPTATVAAGLPVPANVPMRVAGLKPTDKIAAIASTGSGTLYIRPGA